MKKKYKFPSLDAQLRKVNKNNAKLVLIYPRTFHNKKSARKIIPLRPEFFKDNKNKNRNNNQLLNDILDIKHDEHAKYIKIE